MVSATFCLPTAILTELEAAFLLSSVRYVCIGTLCGLPVLAITTLLLGSADRVFSDLLESIFNFDALFQWMFENLPENIILLPCCFVCYTLLLYLVMAALCKGGLKEEVKKPKKHGALIAVTMFVMIDVVYVIFSGIQFMCLFTGNIPETYEYAEYAREGFFELLFVALINFFLVLFCNKHFAKNTALQVTMTITCLCTYVMILSSAYRMRMYIHAYHLTFLRVYDYTRSDSEDYVLVENAAIYDPDIPNSIFMWKHFNFMENACYKRCE